MPDIFCERSPGSSKFPVMVAVWLFAHSPFSTQVFCQNIPLFVHRPPRAKKSSRCSTQADGVSQNTLNGTTFDVDDRELGAIKKTDITSK